MALVKNVIISFNIANIGDSRAYSVRFAGLHQLTEDQTIANYMVNTHQITKEQAKTSEVRHILTNSLGTTPRAATLRLSHRNSKAVIPISNGLTAI